MLTSLSPTHFFVHPLLSSDISDIIRYYALHWLVEVFIEDWKQHEGWGKMACQQAEDGTRRALLLSLLLDHSRMPLT